MVMAEKMRVTPPPPPGSDVALYFVFTNSVDPDEMSQYAVFLCGRND